MISEDPKRVYLSPPDVGQHEREALLSAFDSGWIAPVGPDLARFEAMLRDITGRHAVALSSGTAALHLALLATGVEPGDEVFVSTFTFAASANAVAYCGARPVFIDSDSDSWNMNPELLGRALESAAATGRAPKAVVVVDLYGQCADYKAIEPLCDSYGVAIVEDAAEALGASCYGRPAGAFGNLGTLSFNGNKIMTTSGGGALLTDDEDTAARARYLSTQARQPAVHYQHTEIGYNYRLSNLLAALGCAQLERLREMAARRRQISEMYRSALADTPLSFMPIPEWSRWNGWLTCVCFETSIARDRVMHTLDEANIESRPLWKPLHLQPAFSSCSAHVDGTSERLFELGLCLPSGSALSDSDIERTTKLVMSAIS